MALSCGSRKGTPCESSGQPAADDPVPDPDGFHPSHEPDNRVHNTEWSCIPWSGYERFNSSNDSIHTWSWNYRDCWHQTCSPVATHHCVWVASIPSCTDR